MKIRTIQTLVLGSGAAGLAAAVRLRAEGVEDVAILTEGLNKGTSINTGSDKQTYYKLGICGDSPDSPKAMAATYLTAGAADGDLALVEAATSTRAFFHLVDLGVPFPRDAFGQYVGYKTDHDPAKRATSCGPYASREMCRALIREVKRLNITVYENRVAVKTLAVDVDKNEKNNAAKIDDGVPRKKIVGLIAVSTTTGELEIYRAQNIVFAVGGPGGLYRTSVYPQIHLGAIGLALEIGALARNLPESQFGLASFTDVSQRVVNKEVDELEIGTKSKEFRWNVSGTFMQVVPKFFSTAADGVSEPREFLKRYFDEPGDLFGRIFLKGYQWPFDVRKAIDGSSAIDLCVFYETAILGRRVFLDYRDNPQDFDFKELPTEAFEYLQKSDALAPTPFERLRRMNPGAIELYRDHGIDLANEPLEIAVCAQHNNGGLAVDVWFRSLNVDGLFPIGEVAGTHGVARPGGSALNAGQVGAFRVAEWIANRRCEQKDFLEIGRFQKLANDEIASLVAIVERAKKEKIDWRVERDALRKRTSETAGIFRSKNKLEQARRAAFESWEQTTRPARIAQCKRTLANVEIDAIRFDGDALETLRNVQLSIAQNLYLDAIYENIVAGVGSRGSALTTSENGLVLSKFFPDDWRMQPENECFRSKILYTFFSPRIENDETQDASKSFWLETKKIPETEEWFENVWRDFREGKFFDVDRLIQD